MIDYEKLKVAQTIAEQHNLTLTIDNFKLTHNRRANEWNFQDLDDCIKAMEATEITKPEPKYKVGQKIWVQSHKFDCENVISTHAFEGTVVPCIECDFGLSEPYVRVISGNDEFSGPESICFLTRQSLIEHQLQYWQNQLEDELEQHVSPYCEPLKECKHCTDGWTQQVTPSGKFTDAEKCIYCNDEPDIQSNQSQVDVDGCQHEFYAYYRNPSEGTVVSRKCIKCGEFYR